MKCAIAPDGATADAVAMTHDIAFTFETLPETARRHIRVFQIHQFLDRFAMGLTVAVVALALTDRGMDLFQISLLFGVYSLTTMTTELPFGGLADSIGRKPVFLGAVGASLMALALFLLIELVLKRVDLAVEIANLLLKLLDLLIQRKQIRPAVVLSQLHRRGRRSGPQRCRYSGSDQ